MIQPQWNETDKRVSYNGFQGRNKHVLIQYGGNWCSWCIKFDAFCKADTAINII